MAQEMRVGGGGFGFGTAYANAANASRQLALQEREQAQRELQALAQLQLQRQAAAQAQANNVQQMGLQYAQLGAQQNNARMQAGMGILNQRAEAEQAQREMDFRSREAMAQRDFQAQQSGAEMGFKAEQEDLNRQVQMAEVAGRRDEAEALRKQTQAIKDREFTYLKEKDKQELEEKKAKREEDRRAREMLLDEKKTEARANNLLKRKTRAQEILQDAVKYGDEPMIAKAKAALDKVTEEEDQMIRDAERADQIGEEERGMRGATGIQEGEEVEIAPRSLEIGSREGVRSASDAERFAQGIVKERKIEKEDKALERQLNRELLEEKIQDIKSRREFREKSNTVQKELGKLKDPDAAADRLRSLSPEEQGAILPTLNNNVRALVEIDKRGAVETQNALGMLEDAVRVRDLRGDAKKEAEGIFSQKYRGVLPGTALATVTDSGISPEKAISRMRKRFGEVSGELPRVTEPVARRSDLGSTKVIERGRALAEQSDVDLPFLEKTAEIIGNQVKLGVNHEKSLLSAIHEAEELTTETGRPDAPGIGLTGGAVKGFVNQLAEAARKLKMSPDAFRAMLRDLAERKGIDLKVVYSHFGM